jgi:hypothetical protein
MSDIKGWKGYETIKIDLGLYTGRRAEHMRWLRLVNGEPAVPDFIPDDWIFVLKPGNKIYFYDPKGKK